MALTQPAKDLTRPGGAVSISPPCGCSSVVERDLAKVDVEGSSPFTRSMETYIRPMTLDVDCLHNV